MSTSTSAERRPDGAAHKPTPIGLIGLTLADPLYPDDRQLATPPRTWRYAKYAMAIALPLGVAFAAHRISEPEGLDAAEAPSANALEFVTTNDGATAAGSATSRPPARSFNASSFGHSNAVRVRVVLPKDPVVLPIDFDGSTVGVQAQWIGFDGKGNEPPMPWPEAGKVVRAPSRPGAFWLVLSRGGFADTVADLALLVEHPMPNSMATGINGYHMGRWPKAADGVVPRGFIEVTDRLSDFPLSPHLRLSDFVVHDAQDGFPKYLHVRESLLDKIELVVAEIAQMRGRSPSTVKLNVASGFRSPAHNNEVSGTAQDSRHMYGDAADIAIDANSDGRLTEIDARLVAAAAEIVERKYPDMVGGIGLYITTDGAGWPYVHIDTRGRRARWRGGVKRGGAVAIDSLPADASFDSSVAKPAAITPASMPTPMSAPALAPTVGPAVAPTSSATPAPIVAGPTIAAPKVVLPAPTSASPVPAKSVAPTTVAPRPGTARPAARTTSTRTAVKRAPTARRAAAAARKPAPRTSKPRTTGLIMQSAAAHSRSTVRPSPTTPAARTAEDPFASAAKKFRTSRP